MDEAVVHQTEHMTTIEASAVSQQVQQVHLDAFISLYSHGCFRGNKHKKNTLKSTSHLESYARFAS